MSRPKQVDRSLANVLRTSPLDQDALRNAVQELCNRCSLSNRTPQLPPKVLFDSFNALKESKSRILKTSGNGASVIALSSAMLKINDLCLQHSEGDFDRFTTLSKIRHALSDASVLLKDASVKDQVHAQLKQAVTIGQKLLHPENLQSLLKRKHEPSNTARRLVEVCDFMLVQGLASASEESIFKAIATEWRSAGSESSDNLLEIEQLRKELEACVVTVERPLVTLAEMINHLCSSSNDQMLKETLFRLTKLRLLRKSDSDSYNRISEMVFRLSDQLCSLPQDSQNHFGAFHNRCDMYFSVCYDDDSLSREDILEKVKARIVEAYQLGSQMLESQGEMDRLRASGQAELGKFYARFGEVCRAHRVYSLGKQEELGRILEHGVEAFQKASDLTSLSDPRHVEFNCPRHADCLRSLKRFEEAILAFEPIFERTSELQRQVVWQAHRVVTEIKLNQAWLLGEQDAVLHGKYLSEAEQQLLSAGKVWEPGTDLREIPSTNHKNRLIHSSLAWVYFNQHDWPSVVKQAGFFLTSDSPDNLNQDHVNFRARTAFVLAQAQLALGDASSAVGTIQKLLDWRPDPQQILHPLITLLHCQKRLNESVEVQARTTQQILQTCKNAKGTISLRNLPEELIDALASPSAVAAAIRWARALLESGRIQDVLDALPVIVMAVRLIYGEDSPELLTLLATADRMANKPDDALKALDHIKTLDASPRNQTIVWNEIGKVHEQSGNHSEALKAFQRSYQTYGFDPNGLAACCRMLRTLGRQSEAVDLLNMHKGVDKKWPGFLVREMTALLREPAAKASFESAILKTSNTWFLELIQRAMTVDTPVVLSMIHAAQKRLAEPDLGVLEDCILKLLSRALARVYFAQGQGEPTFDELAHALVMETLNALPVKRRKRLLAFLTQCRDSLLFGTLLTFVEAAAQALAPVLDFGASPCTTGDLNRCLWNMKLLLVSGLPEKARPVGYRNMVRIRITSELFEEKLMNIFQSLRTDPSLDPPFEYSVKADDTWALLFDWWKFVDALSQLFDFSEGPLSKLITKVETWEIKVVVEDQKITMQFQFEGDLEEFRPDVDQALRTDVADLADVEYLEYACVAESRLSTLALTLSRTIMRPTNHPSPPKLQPLLDFLDHSQTSFLETRDRKSNFFSMADALFPDADHEAFFATQTAWVNALQGCLDQGFSLTLLWLLDSPCGPCRTVLHDLKNKLKNSVTTSSPGMTSEAVASLCEELRQAFGNLVQFTLNALSDARPLTDIVGLVRILIAEKGLRNPDSKVNIIPNYIDEPLIAVHQTIARSILSNLIENSITEVLNIGEGDIHVTISQARNEDGASGVLISLRNPCNRNRSDDEFSTGIGLRTVKHLVKSSGGQFTPPKAPDKTGMWPVRIWLPAAI